MVMMIPTHPISSYVGRHAELYDLFYAEKPYAVESRFVHDCLQKFSSRPVKRLLELACGTGNHSFLLEKYGYEIIATDYSNDMLVQARHKSESKNSRVDFRQQDMRTLDLHERPFDAVICLFDSIGYVATNENIGQVLRNVHDHLKTDGLFIFEFWHAGAMLRGFDRLRIRRWKTQDSEFLRIAETTVDYQTQLCHVAYSIYELNNNGTYNAFQETQINRFFLIQEMSEFLISSGLIPVKWFAGFEQNEQVTENTWHIVGVAQAGNAIERSS